MTYERSTTERVDGLDMSLFATIAVGGSSDDDLCSLLAIQAAVAARGTFTYLEIGAYLGRSLQALVVDPRCRGVTVIDCRDKTSPDVRDDQPEYPDNTTESMIGHLEQVPDADLSKLIAIDATIEDLDAEDISADVCFIDAEHTNDAAFRDARFCRQVLRNRGIIVFHDRTLVGAGIRRFLRESRPARTYPLAHDLLVVELGVPTLLTDHRVRRQLPRRAWLAVIILRAVQPALWLTDTLRRRERAGARHRALHPRGQ